MSEFSNSLKARADLGAILGEFMALKPGGNGWVGLCPFHGEKTPSFHVHREKRFYYCFGCHAHGDVYQFVMQIKQIAFPEAVEWLAERLGVPVPRTAEADADPERKALLRIHAAAAEYFERGLAGREGVQARAYLQERDIADATAREFGLGYAGEAGRGLTAHLEKAGFTAAQALRSGLCLQRRDTAPADGGWADLYDRFRHRLMFPIRDERGRVIAFGGRALGQDPTGRTPKYLNSPEHPLYTKGRVVYNLDRARAAVQALKYTILVEGYFDCIRVSAAGFHNVVASCGTALTPAQVRPLARLAPLVLLNFDPDAAGAAAAERSIGLLLEEGLQTRVVVLEGGLDPDLYVRRHGREAYARALESSQSFFDYLAKRAQAQFDLRRGEGKVAAVNHILPYLSHVHDPILRQSLAENLAGRLGVDQPVLSRQLLDAARQRRTQIAAPAAARGLELLPAERVVLRAWLEQEAGRADLEARVAADGLLDGLASEPLWERLRQGPGGSDWPRIMEGLDTADRRVMAEISLGEAAEGEVAREAVEEALRALWERRARGQIQALRKQIEAAAAAGDRARLEELLRSKQAWDARLRAADGPDSGQNATAAGR